MTADVLSVLTGVPQVGVRVRVNDRDARFDGLTGVVVGHGRSLFAEGRLVKVEHVVSSDHPARIYLVDGRFGHWNPRKLTIIAEDDTS